MRHATEQAQIDAIVTDLRDLLNRTAGNPATLKTRHWQQQRERLAAMDAAHHASTLEHMALCAYQS